MRNLQVWKCFSGPGDPIDVTGDWAGKTVNEIASELPAGVYTTLRTYGRTQTIRLEQHFGRLRESIRVLGGSLDVGILSLRNKMRIAIHYSPFQENRIRIHIPINKQKPTAFLIVEELTLPSPGDYQNGVEVVSIQMHRDHAEAKFTDFIQTSEEIRRKQSSLINEVIMVGDDDSYLEGLSSNFYSVEQGKIWTAQKGVLAGITRGIITEIIQEKQYPFIFEGFSVSRTSEIDEAFLTSTSRGVLPVVSIDGIRIGSGLPGPITQELRTCFDKKIQQMLEQI